MESADKAVGSVVGFFEKLITDFSWRRLGFIFGFLVLTGSALVVYELYTQSLRLNRLDREIALLERLVALESSVRASADESIVASFDSLKARLQDAGRSGAGSTLLSASWQKAIYTTIPWFALSLLVAVSPGGGVGRAIGGMAFVAVPLIVLNANLQDFQPRWINHWLIPWGEVLLVVLFILAWQRLSKK